MIGPVLFLRRIMERAARADEFEELEMCRKRADMVGVSATFEVLYRAELYRFQQHSGEQLSPTQILQIAVATHPRYSNGRPAHDLG